MTPLLWRALDLELNKSDGSLASIQMMRPLWWLEQFDVEEGGTIDLAVTEAGLYGTARILSIEANVQANSQRGPPDSAIVIGKIRHENAEVISLVLNGDEANALGVTPDHPLYSKDRDAWVKAGEFEVGEAIQTSDGSVGTVTAKRARVSPESVWNLEVHRAESYYVGDQGLLAHNTGIGCGNSVRKLWEINRFDKKAIHKEFGVIKRDPGGNKYWWAKDNANHGHNGQSAWKVFKAEAGGLRKKHDVDRYGDFMDDKHQGKIGEFIPWSELNMVPVNYKH